MLQLLIIIIKCNLLQIPRMSKDEVHTPEVYTKKEVLLKGTEKYQFW